jgi:ubiquitin-associated SH3 domain-containing protein
VNASTPARAPWVANLIVYLLPTGPLAEALGAYWRDADALGPNTALSYPPHCTVTGFFARPPDRVDAVAAALDGAARSRLGDPPVLAVRVESLVIEPRWHGLVLASPELEAFSTRLVDDLPTGPGEEPVRSKQGPHVSLAYGFGAEAAAELADLARRLVSPRAGVGWDLALCERALDGTWSEHLRTPLGRGRLAEPDG